MPNKQSEGTTETKKGGEGIIIGFVLTAFFSGIAMSSFFGGLAVLSGLLSLTGALSYLKQ
jgi:hypothetical protein